MSGTSVDAIDAALVEIEGTDRETRVRLADFASYEFPREVRRRLFELFDPSRARIEAICHLDFIMGELFAEAAAALIRRAGLSADDIDLIGSAGQTIWHDPRPFDVSVDVDWIDRPLTTRSTLAIGQSAVIAERTGILTVGDLRVRDVAAGGQGAPLIAYADWILLRHPEHGRCIQNIGGIGNVTYLPPGGGLDEVIAFDTGPGNMIIDALADIASAGSESFDRDGALASRGSVREALLSEWLTDPYFSRTPPKTTGREHFGAQFARRALTSAQIEGIGIEDLVATATALTAASIAAAYRDFILPIGPIDEIIIGGGGGRNPALLRELGKRLPGKRILRHEDLGIDGRAKEAIAIAIIARDSMTGRNTNVPGATGGRATVLGKINL